MKKNIVINASKDRSRIAIVEDGQLAELYVEHPGNVRTIGNIVLGRVQKVKPDLKAAFVDIGQKQDAFLHFSDLTDNLAHLLSLVGENVPGLDEPVLSLSPKKQVADDPDEPDIEEKLEVESEDRQQDKQRSRKRRSRNRRSRGRKGGRKREEEEEEESGDGLPFVIDLTKKTGTISTSTKKERGSSTDRSSTRNPKGKSRSSKTNKTESGRSNGRESNAKETKEQKADAKKSKTSKSETKSGSKRGRRRGRRGSGGSKSRKSKDAQSKDTQTKEQKTQDKTPSSGSRSSGGKKSEQKRSSQRSQRGSSKQKQKKRTKRPNAKLAPPQELLRDRGNVLVKITKEPFASKGSRVSTDISLAGRFLVLVPAAEYVAVSKKINSYKERRRLRNLAQNLKPDGFGVIVRTVADRKNAKALETDMRLLVEKWRSIEAQLRENTTPPVTLYEDVNMVSSIMRDLFTDDYDQILVDDPRLFKNLHAFVKAVAPKMADRVRLHRSNKPIFRAVGIERQVKQAFSKRVDLKSGGYLFIETTEAMHVIDVNSGRAGKGKSYQQNLLDVNLEAADEIARQLRLRDLGGIIVVDFIDLNDEGNRRKVARALQDAFKKDRAVTKLLPMSDFGIVQITRQRLRPSITSNAENGSEDAVDPAEAARLAGADEIPQPDRSFNEQQEEKTPREFSEELGTWLAYYRDNVGDRYRKRPIVVRVHPLAAGYLRRGFPSPLTRWRLKLRNITFHLEEDTGIDPLSYKIEDQKSGRSLLSKYKVSD